MPQEKTKMKFGRITQVSQKFYVVQTSFNFFCIILYLAGPPLGLVLSSTPFQMILLSCPVVGDFPIANRTPASKAFRNRKHTSLPSEFKGKKALVRKAL